MSDEKEKKRAELRARMEAAAPPKKKGFMTPARKNKLRQLLRKKAAEELKRQAERKAEERRQMLIQRTGIPKDLSNANEAEIITILKEYQQRLYNLSGDKYDLEYQTAKKDFEITDLKGKVNDLRGKFVIPPLKKVSATARQLEKMRQFTMKIAKMNMRGELKTVKKEIVLDDGKDAHKSNPEWGMKAKDTSAKSAKEDKAAAGDAAAADEE